MVTTSLNLTFVIHSDTQVRIEQGPAGSFRTGDLDITPFLLSYKAVDEMNSAFSVSYSVLLFTQSWSNEIDSFLLKGINT